MLPLMPTAPRGSNIYQPLSGSQLTQASATDEPDETQSQPLSGWVNVFYLFLIIF
jgi:hypothetical protein